MPAASRFKPPTFEGGQDIRDRAFEYACEVVGFCEYLSAGDRVSRLMVPQLLSCSLSFATMLEEARGAESDRDFISKCCIGLKECRESWTRLRVCERRKKGPPVTTRQLVQEGSELIAIVARIIATKRKSSAAKQPAEKAAHAAQRAALQSSVSHQGSSVTPNS
ncbi:MAG TPA: four helix bundle protein [Vicinamibacterales bacterium]|nr:four helix bundle protein [Vicinamibacterales bacterium]